MNSINLIGSVVIPAAPEGEGGKLYRVRLTLRLTQRWWNNEGPREERYYTTLLAYEQQARLLVKYGQVGTLLAITGQLISRPMPKEDGRLEQLVRVQQVTLLKGKDKGSARVPAYYDVVLIDGLDPKTLAE